MSDERRWLRFARLLLLTVVLLLAWPAAAKGPVDKITVGGPLLDGEVEMADPAVLEKFSPWAAQYLDAAGPLAEPPIVWDRVPYEVYFYLADDDGEMELSYVLYYYPRNGGRNAYVYLPGADEPYHDINAELILSANDGKWFNADPAWEAAVEQALVANAAPDPETATAPGAGPAPWIVTLLSAAVAGAVLWLRTR